MTISNQLPFRETLEHARTEVRSRVIDTACHCAAEIPVIAQHIWAQPQIQELGAQITEFVQNTPYVRSFATNFVGSLASFAPMQARTGSALAGAAKATANILEAGHEAMLHKANKMVRKKGGKILHEMGDACFDSAQTQSPPTQRSSNRTTSRSLVSSSSSGAVALPNSKPFPLPARLAVVEGQCATALAWQRVLQSAQPTINQFTQSTAENAGAWHLCNGLLSKLQSCIGTTNPGIQRAASLAFQFALNAQIARALYQNVANASGRWNQFKQLAAIGLLGAGVEAIHHVFKTDTLKTAQTLALLTMFPRTTEAWMFARAAVCAGTVGGTLGALQEYRRQHGSYPAAIEAIRHLSGQNQAPRQQSA